MSERRAKDGGKTQPTSPAFSRSSHPAKSLEGSLYNTPPLGEAEGPSPD